jgi:hypothetical protein
MKLSQWQKQGYSLLLALSLSCAPAILAQDYMADSDEVLNSEQIDIDGQMRPRKTEADHLANQRKQLEQKNEDMTRKKIEDMRMKEEKKISKKLQRAFNQGLGPVDGDGGEEAEEYSSSSSKHHGKPGGLRLTPFFGFADINGENIEFQSKFSGGLYVEGPVSEWINIGGGFSYTSVELQEYDQSYGSSYYGHPGGSGYNNYYYMGNREMDCTLWTVDMYGKFFFTDWGWARPYGVGTLSYDYNKFKYKDSVPPPPVAYGGIYYGEEQYTSTYFSGALGLGMMFNFNKSFGMGIEFKYKQSLMDASETSKQPVTNPDQENLARVGNAFQNAKQYLINVGFSFIF